MNWRASLFYFRSWRILLRSLTLLPLFLLPVSCGDDSDIPLVQVNFRININQPSYHDLQTIGGWVYVSGGSKGIIIYRHSTEDFKAYDRHCTYRPDEPCDPARVDSSNIKVVCDDCEGSVYNLVDGSVIQGPASQPLKQYNTTFRDDILHVYN